MKNDSMTARWRSYHPQGSCSREGNVVFNALCKARIDQITKTNQALVSFSHSTWVSLWKRAHLSVATITPQSGEKQRLNSPFPWPNTFRVVHLCMYYFLGVIKTCGTIDLVSTHLFFCIQFWCWTFRNDRMPAEKPTPQVSRENTLVNS